MKYYCLEQACKDNDIDTITMITTTRRINGHMCNDIGLRYACIYGRLNIVKFFINRHIEDILFNHKINSNKIGRWDLCFESIIARNFGNYTNIIYYFLSCGSYSYTISQTHNILL